MASFPHVFGDTYADAESTDVAGESSAWWACDRPSQQPPAQALLPQLNRLDCDDPAGSPAEPDGAGPLDPSQPRQALAFQVGDPLEPLLFEGIRAAAGAALPGDQRRSGPDPDLGPTVQATPLAEPLLQFINASRFDTSGTAASLLTPINFNADIFADQPALLTANYGFEGYIGIPGMNGTDASSQQIAAQYNVAWESVDVSLNAAQRAYTSALSTTNAQTVYGVSLLQADNMPLVFSHPLLPNRLNATDFLVSLSDGSRVVPQVAAFLPNLEFNERQTVVISGEFGNRLQPGQSGALYPTAVTVVNDGSPLELLTANGPVSAVGLSQTSSNPYVSGNGPSLLAAKLNRINNLGEGGPIGVSLASQNNSGFDLYGNPAQYRLRLYTSAGFSPDGIASLLPSQFSRYFSLEATAADGSTIAITQANVPVSS